MCGVASADPKSDAEFAQNEADDTQYYLENYAIPYVESKQEEADDAAAESRAEFDLTEPHGPACGQYFFQQWAIFTRGVFS